MKVMINNASMQPIYEQIVEQIKSQIAQQELAEGTPLPSVRGLAKDLKISALTVKKAYDFLEQEGLDRNGARQGKLRARCEHAVAGGDAAQGSGNVYGTGGCKGQRMRNE